MRPGDRFERYVIERVLGEGGMATVYLGRHETLQSAHALKVLRVDVPEIKRRLMAEGQVQSAIRHPNVVAVNDIVDSPQGVALVMEYVDGPALDEYQNGRGLPIEEALALFRGVVLGVGEAHRVGVVHRDLKPANVLLHRTSNAGVIPKVTDFGLVKVFEGGGTRSGVTMGTPEYMSPEQVRDSANVDARADLWSLGVLLYEMLTGDVPFDGPDLLEIYNAIAKGRYVPLGEMRSDVPDFLIELVERLLVVEVDRRLQSTEDVLAFLDARTTPSEPAPTASLPPTLPGATSRGGTAGGVALLVTAGVILSVLLCAGGGAAGLWWTQRAPEVATRDVVVTVSGLPTEVERVVQVGAQRTDGREPLHLGSLVVDTPVAVSWSIGPGCGTCPETCPAWCTTGEDTLMVSAGEGPLVHAVSLSEPAPRDVLVQAPHALSAAYLEGVEGQIDGKVAGFSGVALGEHELVVEAGECPLEARGCGGPEMCPPGCVSMRSKVVVIAGEGPENLEVELAAPVEPEAPAPVVPIPVAPKMSGRVSGRSFARFIERHPEWSREEATRSGKADAGYLRDWKDGPPAGPVTRVTWAAAEAYCAGRGGLLELEAEPTTWASRTVKQEWRSAGGRPAWRRQDGKTSTAASSNRAFPLTGFRCKR